jgi:pimeloyl-ACP methyl ester carboxylesterase
VLGHSEGSLFAILAANKELVSGLISIAGAADPIDVIIEKQLSVQSKSIAQKARVIMDSLKKGYSVASIPEGLNDLFSSSMQPYMQTWLNFTPTEELAKIHEPILVVQGTNDIQVGTDQAKKLNSANDRAQLLLINGMNHVLKNAPEDRAGNLATYSNPDLALCPGLVSGIVHFITTPPPPARRKH